MSSRPRLHHMCLVINAAAPAVHCDGPANGPACPKSGYFSGALAAHVGFHLEFACLWQCESGPLVQWVGGAVGPDSEVLEFY
jgi:hypothetical protein